jgi:hypothetical protein
MKLKEDKDVGPRVPVRLEALKWRLQIDWAKVAKKLMFQSGPAMISLLKWDLMKIEMKYKKMQEVEEASSMLLFIAGLWLLLKFWFRG